jgi:hypothetical protein
MRIRGFCSTISIVVLHLSGASGAFEAVWSREMLQPVQLEKLDEIHLLLRM